MLNKSYVCGQRKAAAFGGWHRGKADPYRRSDRTVHQVSDREYREFRESCRSPASLHASVDLGANPNINWHLASVEATLHLLGAIRTGIQVRMLRDCLSPWSCFTEEMPSTHVGSRFTYDLQRML